MLRELYPKETMRETGISMPPKKGAMTPEHKAALAEGRAQGRAIRLYLEALEAHKPKRGRRRTEASITARLDAIEELLPDADPVKRLDLIQERLDLDDELAGMRETVDMSALEKDFTAAAAGYSERKGISYSAWRELGVEPAVLKKAGIPRTRRR